MCYFPQKAVLLPKTTSMLQCNTIVGCKQQKLSCGGCILTGVIGRRMLSNRRQSTMPANMQNFARGLSLKLACPARSSGSVTPAALSRQASRQGDAQADASLHQSSMEAALRQRALAREMTAGVQARGKPRRASLLFRQPSRAAAVTGGDLQSVAR